MAEIKRIFIVNCKNCGTTLRVRGGSKLYMCPNCRKLFTIPAQEQPVQPQMEEVAPLVADETPETETAEQPPVETAE